MKNVSLYLQALFYIIAGANHFVDPGFYYPLIPDYLQEFSLAINRSAGIVEIALGIGLIVPIARKRAAFGIFLMLIAFIPSHVYFIQIGGCIEGGLCVPAWVGWIRLILVHPLLMWWACSVRNL